MEIRINENQNDLYCIECKEHIEVGAKFATINEDCLGEIIVKDYHMTCTPLTEEE